MSVIDNRVFKAEIPRTAAELIPDNYSQEALNGRLLSGNLEAWNDLLSILTLPKGTNVVSIHLMARQFWLHWLVSELGAGQVSVDVALGAIPADISERTYYTGTDAPRVTDVAKATFGGGANYPIGSLLLGIPAPTTAPAVDASRLLGGYQLTSYDDCSSLASWTTGFTGTGSVTVDAGIGNPLPSFKLNTPFGSTAYLSKDASVAGLASFAHRFDFSNVQFAFEDLIFIFGSDSTGKGLFCQISRGKLSIGTVTDGVNLVEKFSGASGLSGGGPAVFYTATVECSVGLNSVGVSVSITNSSGAMVGQLTGSIDSQVTSTFIAFYNNGSNFSYAYYIDNIMSFAGGLTSVATNYVYTWVNEYGEEGPPSPVSNTFTKSDGNTIVVTGIADPSGGVITARGITKKYLYRAVTGETTTQFQFVAEVLVGTTTYTDTIDDADTGELLASESYDLPPSDGHSILALPNAIMVMASKNQIVPSVQNRPHAYPVGFRLTTDYPVVALGAIDTNVIVATSGGPYLVIGSDPSALSMSKLELPQGCVSKRSLASLKGFGVIYASPDGLIGVNAVGNVQILTEKWLTRRDWQAFKPESIIATVHDDRYFCSYDTGTVQGTFVFDPKDMGWMPFDFHFNAEFYDTYTDRLFLVTSANNLQAWDEALTKRPYTWKSKSWLLPRAESPAYCRIRARDYTSVTLTLFDGATAYYTKTVTNENEFPLPSRAVNEFSFRLAGTSRVTGITFVEEVGELR